MASIETVHSKTGVQLISLNDTLAGHLFLFTTHCNDLKAKREKKTLKSQESERKMDIIYLPMKRILTFFKKGCVFGMLFLCLVHTKDLS